VSDFVLDASLALQWFLEDEADRKYSLAVLASLSEKRAWSPTWLCSAVRGQVVSDRFHIYVPLLSQAQATSHQSSSRVIGCGLRKL